MLIKQGIQRMKRDVIASLEPLLNQYSLKKLENDFIPK